MTVVPVPGGAWIDAVLASRIALSGRRILALWETLGGAPGLRDDLEALADVARQGAAGSVTGSVAGSVVVPTLDGSRVGVRASGWMTTRDAAERLKVTSRAVLKARAKGRLTGRQREAHGRWLISVESVEALASMRESRKETAA